MNESVAIAAEKGVPMKFYPLATPVEAKEVLAAGYKEGRDIGTVHLGAQFLYFRNKLKVYYIPYADIRRCFRRVMLIPATMCCGKGDFEVENMVICGEAGELAQIQLPGERAGKILLEELTKRAPHAEIGKPKDSAE